MIHGQNGYSPELDQQRLESLLHRVRAYMIDGQWRTLREIQSACGGSEASCSARLRELRADFLYDIQKKRAPNSPGLWLYRMSFKTDEHGNGLLPGLSA